MIFIRLFWSLIKVWKVVKEIIPCSCRKNSKKSKYIYTLFPEKVENVYVYNKDHNTFYKYFCFQEKTLLKNVFISRKKHINEKYFCFQGKAYKGKIFLFPGKEHNKWKIFLFPGKNIIIEKYFCFHWIQYKWKIFLSTVTP